MNNFLENLYFRKWIQYLGGGSYDVAAYCAGTERRRLGRRPYSDWNYLWSIL